MSMLGQSAGTRSVLTRRPSLDRHQDPLSSYYALIHQADLVIHSALAPARLAALTFRVIIPIPMSLYGIEKNKNNFKNLTVKGSTRGNYGSQLKLWPTKANCKRGIRNFNYWFYNYDFYLRPIVKTRVIEVAYNYRLVRVPTRSQTMNLFTTHRTNQES